MSDNTEKRVEILERELRTIKLAFSTLVLVVIGLATVGALHAQVTPPSRLDANRILLRRTDGSLVAELRAEDAGEHYDLTLRDAKGMIRLSLAGLTGLNIPPTTAMQVHDAKGESKISIFANDKRAGFGISAAPPVTEINLDQPGRSQTRLGLVVEGENGSLTFFDKDSRRVLAIPNQ